MKLKSPNNIAKQFRLLADLVDLLLNKKIPYDMVNMITGEILIPANRKITVTLLKRVTMCIFHSHGIEMMPSQIRNQINELIKQHASR